MEQYFRPGGALSGVLPDFEPRPGQMEMARAVEGVFTDGGALLAEAGTGIGKTLAYLVPAAASGRKIMVSTGTRNLQEQIAGKDIPVVEKLFPGRFEVAVMKGRGNYLCKRRFKSFSQRPLFADSQEGRLFAAIDEWAARTATGDRAELAELPDDYSAWSDINSKSELCLGSACPHHSSCFITKMRADAAHADIVIVNHHLFFADLNVRNNAFGEVIPAYDAVVFDEAHMVEEVATAYFGITVSNYRVAEAVRDAERELKAAKLSDVDTARVLRNLEERSARFFAAVRGDGEGARRLRKIDRERWAGQAQNLLDAINVTADHMASLKKANDAVKALSIRFADIAEQLSEVAAMGKDDCVYWVEARGRGVFLRESPIDVSGLLRENLYPRSGSIVFTSATMAAGGDFSFIRQRLGIDEADEMAIESPFDYENNAVFYLPQDMPEPQSDRFADTAAGRIEKLLEMSRGRAFVLFTSKRNMEKCWELLKDRLPYTVLKQGEGPRTAILDRFREDTHSTLFATFSFWQGVDVKGESLSAVIIDKLPFATPDDPLVSARIELINRRGGSAFLEYQVPSAALLLKQGLGRLIRSNSDSGLLAVLDRRMKTKSYGAKFMKSLPRFPVTGDLEEVGARLEKMWGPAAAAACAPPKGDAA